VPLRGRELLGERRHAALRNAGGLEAALLRGLQQPAQLQEALLQAADLLLLALLRRLALLQQLQQLLLRLAELLLLVLVNLCAVRGHLGQALLQAVQLLLPLLLLCQVLVRRLYQAGPDPPHVPHEAARGAGAELHVERVGRRPLAHVPRLAVHAVLDPAVLVHQHLDPVAGAEAAEGAREGTELPHVERC